MASTAEMVLGDTVLRTPQAKSWKKFSPTTDAAEIARDSLVQDQGFFGGEKKKKTKQKKKKKKEKISPGLATHECRMKSRRDRHR